MTVGLIGCGSIGRRHLRHLLALGRDVIAYDVDPAQRPEAARWSSTWPTGVDAYVLATPAASHAADLARVGDAVPIYVEKPLAMTAAEAAALPALHPASVVGYQLRYHPAVRRAAAMVARGALGTPIRARVWVYTNMATWPGRAYADALLECSHEIDVALHLLGPARCVGAVVADAGASWVLTLQHVAGHQSRIEISGCATEPTRGAHLVGPQGADHYLLPRTMDDTYREAIRQFCGRVSLGPTHRVGVVATIADATAVLHLIEEARQRARREDTAA